MTVLRTLAAAGAMLLASLSIGTGGVSAQDYPSKPVKILVGAPPGGSSDIGGRLLAMKLQERLGQPFIIENKPGAAGALAAQEVTRAKPDGYTLLFTASWHSTAAAIKTTLPYDSLKDFTFISTLTTYGLLIGVRPESELKSLKDLIAYGKANPGKLTFYSVGIGSAHHLIGEWINSETGTEMIHVPYKGSSAAFPDFITGRVDVMIDTMTFALTQVKAGKARALAISSAEPLADLPGVPITKQVVPGLEYDSWLGLLGPPGLDAAVLAKLNKEMHEIVKQPDVIARLADLGALPRAMSPDEFRGRVAREIKQFQQIVATRKIPME